MSSYMQSSTIRQSGPRTAASPSSTAPATPVAILGMAIMCSAGKETPSSVLSTPAAPTTSAPSSRPKPPPRPPPARSSRPSARTSTDVSLPCPPIHRLSRMKTDNDVCDRANRTSEHDYVRRVYVRHAYVARLHKI